MPSNILTPEQITAGNATLQDNKLLLTQVEDLLSMFREFLNHLAENYPIEATLKAETDTGGSQKCAKLAACLLLWQDNQFANGGLEATRTVGVNFSIDVEDYRIFKYAFGLFWSLPIEMENRFVKLGNNRQSQSGEFINLWS
jgi:hypothetical protein